MSWMLRRAWGKVAAGGGAARIMSPLPSAPRPPGHTPWWGAPGGTGGISPTAETTPAPGTSSGWPVAGVSICRGQRPNTRPPPPPHPRAGGSCVRVCVLGVRVGGAVSPVSSETWDLSEPGSRGWGPSPFVAKGRWIFPHTSQPRSSGDLCTPKSPTVPLIPFLPQSFFPEALPDFPVRFIASLHCS